MMPCSAVKAALAAWDPEGTRDLPNEVVEHLDTCPGCRGAFDRVAGPVAIDESARVMPAPVRARVRARIAEEAARSPSWRWLWALVLGGGSLTALAGVAAVAFAFVVLTGGVEGTTLAAKKLAGAPTKNTQDEVHEEHNAVKQDVTIGGGGGAKANQVTVGQPTPTKSKSASTKTSSTPSTPSTTQATSTTPEVPAGPGRAPLTIKLNGGSATYVRISCTDGYVQKIKLDALDSATATDVPLGEDCKVSLEGGSDVASYNRAVAGKSYVCDVEPPQLICR